MKQFYILFILFISLLSCDKKETKINTLTDYIPNNPSVIISAPSIQKLQSELKENSFIKSFSATKTFQNLKNDFSFCDNIESDNSILISYATVGKTLEYLFTIKAKNLEHKIEVNTTKKSYNNISYQELKNQKAYTLVLDSTLVVSSSEILIENLIRNNTDNIRYSNSSFLKLHGTSDHNKVSAYLNNEKKPFFFNSIFPTQFLGNTNWTSVELNNNNGLSINGITTNTTIAHSFAKNLLQSKTEESNISEIIPLNFLSYTTYTFEELKNFDSPFENFNELIDNSTEATSFREEKNSSCAFKLLNTSVSENLTELNTYRNTPIYKNTYFKIPTEISKKQPEYACYLGDFLILSNNIGGIQNCISHYQNKTTLNNQYFFTENTDALLREAHITNSTKTTILKNKLAAILDDSSIRKVELTEFPIVMNQITFEDNYIQFNSVIKKVSKQKTEASISQVASINLPADIASTLQWVTNHKTKEKELVVQDKNNVLYLISNKGTILWNKQLNGEIQGDIIQVDLFKNRKLQLAFTTNNEFLVLDRNGKVVEQFHKKFSDGNVLPLSVFDYDKNRNYRFVISHGNQIAMYDNKFSPIKGFKFTKTKSNIVHSPQHIRIGTKDYIVISETNGTLHILNRQGKLRTNIKTKFDFDTSKFSNHKNGLVFKDRNNTVHRVNISSGKVSKLDLLQGNTLNFINYSNNSTTKLEDNILTINDKTVELDFGNYSAPEIFYNGKKYYINITDLDSQKTYIYNNNAKLLNQFPVYGQSAIALTNMDIDAKLEFAVKGEANSILIYKMY
ncbi:MAG: PQQ-binding-like beta-propeller repeat protein [Flavobacteriaceae bacterium]|nr:PQQ-binding-like beta-propeller repeat protein [Flavobacteriaceae bacterium]